VLKIKYYSSTADQIIDVDLEQRLPQILCTIFEMIMIFQQEFITA
jgi:hypothetical protein